MNKALLIIVGMLVVLVGGFAAFNAYIYAEKQGDPKDITSYRGTLTGEVVCLPHKDKDGPQTKECAYGLRTDVGEHYALDVTTMSQEHSPLETGERITANGLIIPVEILEETRLLKYDIVGVFAVTDSVLTD